MAANKTDIEIRLAEDADKVALRKLFLASRQTTFSWAKISRFKLSDYDLETKGEKVIAAFCGLKLVGFVSIYMEDNFIHHLYVDGDFQNRGIGSALLKVAVSLTGFPLRLKCLEKNTRALAYYRSKGFVQKGKGVSEMGVYFDLEKPGL